METSDVRSIESLRMLRTAIGILANDWEVALQQIRASIHRTEDHFSNRMPEYWKNQTRAAEQKLSEALNNLSHQQGNASSGQAPAVTEAKQRVQLAKRRLADCEEKVRLAAKVAIQFETACQELAGPIAEVVGHTSVTLPNAAGHLAVLISHLDRYAERTDHATVAPKMPPSPAPQDEPAPHRITQKQNTALQPPASAEVIPGEAEA
jgi:hypothetical protein